VGAEPDKTQYLRIGLRVDQQKIGFQVAFAMIVPLAR
jgi:hypothetical protein